MSMTFFIVYTIKSIKALLLCVAFCACEPVARAGFVNHVAACSSNHPIKADTYTQRATRAVLHTEPVTLQAN